MRTIIGAVTLSESGSVTTVTLVDEWNGKARQLISMYGFPYLGSYETSEDFRRALGQALADTCADSVYKATGYHGDHIVYVSPGCNLYVYELDFDN